MSSSIIEAKFQALDRTIRLLHKTGLGAKISSSHQLRELVSTNNEAFSAQPNSLYRGRPRTAKHQPSSTKPQPAENPGAGFAASRRPESASWTPQRSGRLPQPPALVVMDREDCATVPPLPGSSLNQAKCTNQSEEKRPISSRGRPVTAASGSKSARAPLTDRQWHPRCQTADAGTTQKPPGRNWFQPQPTQSERPHAVAKKTRKIAPQEPVAPTEDGAMRIYSALASDEPMSVIDEPPFYFLEVRLDHATPLVHWRFCATFTDLSVLPRPSVTVDNVPVNAENCLLFTMASRGSAPVVVQYFDPVHHFAHVQKPRDLYGHCIRILVVSTAPVQRVVIDTLVHFLVDDGSASIQAHPYTAAPPSPQHSPHAHRPVEKLELVLPRAMVQSFDRHSGDYTAWDTHDTNDHHVVAQEAIIAASPREQHSSCSSMDKKKVELQQLRVSMRRKLHEECKQLQTR